MQQNLQIDGIFMRKIQISAISNINWNWYCTMHKEVYNLRHAP